MEKSKVLRSKNRNTNKIREEKNERYRPAEQVIVRAEGGVVKHGRFEEQLRMDKPYCGSGIAIVFFLFTSVLGLFRPLHTLLIYG